MHISKSKLEVLITSNRFIGFPKQINSISRQRWLKVQPHLALGVFFFFLLSVFLFRLGCRKSFSLKLSLVNFITLAWFPFFVPPMGCILSKCFLKQFLSIPASSVAADITFNWLSLFASSFSGFWRPLTIMQHLQEYVSASSS